PTNATSPSHPSLRTPRAGHPRSPHNSGYLRRFPPHIPAAPLHSCRSPVLRSTLPLRSFLQRSSGRTESYRSPQTWDCTSSLPMRFAALLFRRGSTRTCPSFPLTSVMIFHPSPWRFPLLLLVRSLSVPARHSGTALSRYGISLPCSCSCTSISRPATMSPSCTGLPLVPLPAPGLSRQTAPTGTGSSSPGNSSAPPTPISHPATNRSGAPCSV